MFGLLYSIIGLAFGFACSYIAKQKDRSHKDWFMLGFVFSFIALVIVYLIPSTKKESNGMESAGTFDDSYRFSTNF